MRSFSSSDESESHTNTYDAQRKKQQRAREDEQQRSVRLLNDCLQKQLTRDNETEEERDARLLNKRLRTQMTRENETEGERNARLLNNRIQTQMARENETEEERNTRLFNDRTHKEAVRQQESEDEYRRRLAQQQKRTAEHRSNSSKQRKSTDNVYGDSHFETGESNSRRVLVRNSLSRRRTSQERQRITLDQYIWPAGIPTRLKEQCLEDFANCMSMSLLRQSICILCNSRVEFNTMKEYPIEDIFYLDDLSCHSDISHIISKLQQSVQSINREFKIIDTTFVFLKDDDANSSFFFSSNTILHKKGYNSEKNTGYVCQQCHSALDKNKVPIFSSANKMWIGDVPPVLQLLTIAEEKL